MHGHHAAGVVERNHQRRRQVCQAPAQDVAQGFFGAQELHEASLAAGRTRGGVEDAGGEGSEGKITGAAGEVGTQRDEAGEDLEGLGSTDAVVASDDDAAQVEVLDRSQHALEGPQIPVNVADAQQRATRGTGGFLVPR